MLIKCVMDGLGGEGMRLPRWKRIMSLLLSCVLIFTAVSWTDMGSVEALAANYAPNVNYTFEQIADIASIPVMNLKMADSSQYTDLKNIKEKYNISEFELVNTDGKGSDIHLKTTVDSETGENVYPLTVKGRGNSSWRMDIYYEGTYDEWNNIKFDKKQDILGMGKAKSWCLISNWVDTTHMRNYMAYELACLLGMGTPDCEYVALCIDGIFEGIYLITEKVGLNEYRTEIPDSSEDEDKNGDGIITEIIVETDSRAHDNNEPGAFTTNFDVNYVPKDPEAEDLAASELREIEKELNAMEAAIMSGANYEEYIDINSWVDTYIINELTKNPDFGFGYQNYYSSTYLYFREGGKVYAGPVWDFDIAYGRSDYSKMESEGFRDIVNPLGFLTQDTKYYKELFENTDFGERVIKRWKEIRESVLPVWMGETFQNGYNSVKALNGMDEKIWGDHTVRKASEYDMGRKPLAFEDEVAYIKNFLNERVAWLDEQWNIDEVTKKFSGSWTRQDTEIGNGYKSYEDLEAAFQNEAWKANVEDVWDGGFGGKEKSGTEVVVLGTAQNSIPGNTLAKPFTLTMERQRGQYDWSSDTTHAYDIWKDGEAAEGFGSVKDSIQITKSGRYVGLTTAEYYIGDTTAVMGQNNVQVYIIDVGTDGSVVVYDGSVKLSYEGREAVILNTKYSNIEQVSGGYKVSYKSNGRGNAGTVIGGTGNKQFKIYLSNECVGESNQAGVLNIVSRPANSNYADVLLEQEATYVQVEGERPVAWTIDGDAIIFDEETQLITAVSEGTAVITAKEAGGLTSSVTVQVKGKQASDIEYEVDPTLGKYYGNTENNILSASAAEKGTWATIAPETIARFSFEYKMSQEEVLNASSFAWLTKNGDQIIGGAADYYVFINGNPLFAATADRLNYVINGFNEDNTIKIDSFDLPEYMYAYMQGKAGNTENCMDSMGQYIVSGTNKLDIFVSTEEGTAIVLPYLKGTTKIVGDDPVPEIPDVPTEPEEPTTEEPTTEEPTTEEPTTEEPTTEEPTTEEPTTEEPTTEEPTTEEPEEILVEKIEIIEENIVMEYNSRATVTAVVWPEDAEDKTILWSVEDDKIVTVDQNGNLLAVGEGTTKVTAAWAKDSNVKAEIMVTVTKMSYSFSFVLISNKITMEDQSSISIGTQFRPSTVPNKKVIWSSSNPDVVTVENGICTAHKPGTVQITGISEYGNKKATVTISVKPADVTVTIENNNSIPVGEQAELKAVLSKDVTDTSVMWSLVDGIEYAVLTDNVLTGIKVGNVTVKATSNYNPDCYTTKTIAITNPRAQSIHINEGNITLEETKTTKLTATVLPESAIVSTLRWTTSNSKVATVDSKGNITAVGIGKATIKVTYLADSSITDEIVVTVTKMAYDFDLVLADDELTMEDLSSVAIGTQFTPASIPDKTVIWTSSDSSIVSVTDGICTANKPGTVQVTATSIYDNKKAVVTIHVVPTKVNVTINSEKQIQMGESLTLNAVIDKAVADTEVTWSIVSGKDLVTLDGNILTAKEAGIVVVKATSNYNNSSYATTEITIEKLAEEEPAVSLMIPGTPLAKPITITMEKQMGQYEWSNDTTHAYDIWEDGKATQGFGQVKMNMTITKAGRYVGLTSASYYVGDKTVQMGKDNVQVYVIDVANDGSVTVYDGKVKLNYFERTVTVVDTNYAYVQRNNGGYLLSYRSNQSGNTGVTVSN